MVSGYRYDKFKSLVFDLRPDFKKTTEEYQSDIEALIKKVEKIKAVVLEPRDAAVVNNLYDNLHKLRRKLERAILSEHVSNTFAKTTDNVKRSPIGDISTLEECGIALGGVSRERVRQIESGAIKKLKHPKIGRRIRNYLDIGDESASLSGNTDALLEVFGIR